MVEKSQGPEALEDRERDAAATDVAERDVAATGEGDPMLGIVRQLIVEAEAETARAPEPKHGGAGPDRDGAGAQSAAGAPVEAPVQAVSRGIAALSEPWDDAADDAGDGRADPDVDEPDADEWDDWEARYGEGGVRRYGIVDVETGMVGAPDGLEDGPEEGAQAQEPAPRRPRREPVLRRWIGRMLRAGLAWAGRRLAAAGRVIARFLARPDAPRRIAVALLVLFVVAWPWKVAWLTLLVPLAALITWASVGSEGCAELTVRWYERLKARDPQKAERIRLRAAATSRKITKALDRLPERWTSGLYLPDFEPEGYVPEKLKVDPFEELAARIHSEKHAGSG